MCVAGEDEEQGERPRHQQVILHELRVGGEHGKPDHEGEGTPRPVPPVADAAHEHPERERKQGTDEQLAVVSRRGIGRDRSAQQVGHPAGERGRESDSPHTEKAICEQTGQERVNDETPRHPDIGPDQHAQELGGIENVAVHRRNVREAAVQERIPVRDSLSRAEHLHGEVAEREARDELVTVRIDEKISGERRIRQRKRRQRVGEGCPSHCESRRRYGWRRGGFVRSGHPKGRESAKGDASGDAPRKERLA